MKKEIIKTTEADIRHLIEVLELKPKKGYYQTEWGKKTLEGLIETIKSVLYGAR